MAKEKIRNFHPTTAKALRELQGVRVNAVATTNAKYVPVALAEMAPGDTVVSCINDSGGTPANIPASEIVVGDDRGIGFVTMNAANVADTVTVNGLVYTAVAGTATNVQWDQSGDATAEAVSLAASINSRDGANVTATTDGAVVILRPVVKGSVAAAAVDIAESTAGVRISVSGAATTGAAGASATGTAQCTSVVANDTVTINGHLYTAVAVADDNTNDPSIFSIGTSDTECATSLKNKINLRELGKDTITAESSTDTVTITYANFGTKGNAVAMSQTGGTITLSGATLTGGVNPGGNFWSNNTTFVGVPMLLWFNKDDA
jgi:hypothetical protein